MTNYDSNTLLLVAIITIGVLLILFVLFEFIILFQRFSSVLTEICSSRCLWTISAFGSGVQTRFICPFFKTTTSLFILA